MESSPLRSIRRLAGGVAVCGALGTLGGCFVAGRAEYLIHTSEDSLTAIKLVVADRRLYESEQVSYDTEYDMSTHEGRKAFYEDRLAGQPIEHVDSKYRDMLFAGVDKPVTEALDDIYGDGVDTLNDDIRRHNRELRESTPIITVSALLTLTCVGTMHVIREDHKSQLPELPVIPPSDDPI